MDTTNSFKDYPTTADEGEEQAYRRKTRKRLIIIIVSTIILALIIVAALSGSLLPNKTRNSTLSPSSTSSLAVIQSVCSVAQYRDTCVSSLASHQTANKASDPVQLFKLSLQIAIDELSNISAVPEVVASRTNDTRIKTALNECKLLFRDAINQLNDSLSSTKLDDIRTWISAAMTNQETCLSEIGLVSIEFRGLMLATMKNSTEYTSNSLAIATKILKLLPEFDLPMHRKLLGGAIPKLGVGEREEFASRRAYEGGCGGCKGREPMHRSKVRRRRLYINK